MSVNLRVLCAVVAVVALGSVHAGRAAVVIGPITDINNTGTGFGQVNVFSNAPIGVNDTGVYQGNDVTVYTLVGPTAANGAGVAVGISNGENGITSTNNGMNLDPDNTTPADPVFAAIGNTSGRLENGNAIRFSMWMRQDPTNPVVKEPSVEPVLKIELWKQALSGFADFSAVAFPGSGDRIWDTDQNASNPVFVGHNQSQASWVDMNNNGSISNGRPVAVSLVTEEWRLVEATLVVDDDPLDDSLGWSIGSEFFDVTAVEEIRAVMFVGDFAGTDLTAGGSFFIDNLMVEVFADEATMLATPNPNTAPVEGIPGDYNGDGRVDAGDYVRWRNHLGEPTEANINNSGDGGGVEISDYTYWKDRYGNPGSGGGGLATTVPEPAALLLLAIAAIPKFRMRRGARG